MSKYIKIGLLAILCINIIDAKLHNVQRRDLNEFMDKVETAGMQLGMTAVGAMMGITKKKLVR